MNTFVRTLAVLVLVSFWGSHAATAQSAARFLDIDQSKGFARLSMAIPKSEPFSAEQKHGILILEFNRPVSLDLVKLKRALSDYVSLARADKDGRVYRLALKQNFRFQVSRSNDQVAVDIVPRTYRGMPAKLKLSAPNRTTEQQSASDSLDDENKIAELYPVSLRILEKNEFSRIIFDWPEVVDYTAELKNGKLKVHFGVPADPDLVRLRIDPPPFIVTADKAVSRTALDVAIYLERHAGMRHFRDGSSIVIDVLKPNLFVLGGDSDANERSKAAKDLQEKEVPSKSQAVESHSEQDASRDAKERGQEKEISKSPASKSPAQENEALPEKENRPTKERSEQSGPAHESDETVPHPSSDHGNSSSNDAKTNADQQGEHHAAGTPDLNQEADGRGEHENSLAHLSEDDVQAPEAVEEAVSAQSASEDPVEETVESSVGKETKSTKSTSPVHKEEQRATLDPLPLERAVEQQPLMLVEVYEDDQVLSLSFDWGKEVTAAVFSRNEELWIVFDEIETELDLSLVTDGNRRYIRHVKSEIENGVRLVRMTMTKDFLVAANAEEDVWTVALGDRISTPPGRLELNSKTTVDGNSYLRAQLPGHGTINRFEDPSSGGELIVVTGAPPVKGVAAGRSHVEFDILSSVHGLVIKPLTEDMFVQPQKDSIIIGRDGGLIVSHPMETAQALAPKLFEDSTRPGFIDFMNWAGNPDLSFTEIKQSLELNAVRQPAVGEHDDQNADYGRAALARFYLAHGLAAEALGVLRTMERTSESISIDPGFFALRGVANYLAGRYSEAVRDLSSTLLKDDFDAKLWRAAAHWEQGNYADARRGFVDSGNAMYNYPDNWVTHFHVAAADSAIQLGDIENAEHHVTAAIQMDVTGDAEAELSLIRSRLSEAAGDTAAALSFYEQTMALGREPFTTIANFERTKIQHRTKRINTDEAIRRLERLHFQWRGDDLELNILHRLGELYVERGDYKRGLSLMRNVIASSKRTDAVDEISSTMENVFKHLFLDEGANKMSPVKALGLYYEFRELTPLGEEGDRMIRRLADRLISVDLLGQAAELLAHQVEHRLRGLGRSQVANKLALIYLQDRKPDKALQIIRKTRLTRLPESIRQNRRLLEARALAELDRFNHALEVIEGYYDPVFEELRADIYWDSEEWEKAAQKLQELVGRAWEGRGDLNPAQRRQIMRAAVAYALADDQTSLQALRATYADQMASTPDASAFDIVTAPIDRQGSDFRRLAGEIAGIDTLEAFMDSMNQRVETEPKDLDPTG